MNTMVTPNLDIFLIKMSIFSWLFFYNEQLFNGNASQNLDS